MKISKKEIVMMLTTIDTLFRTKYMENEEMAIHTVGLWQELLAEYPKELVISVFKDIIKYQKRAPLPADLVEQLDILCNKNTKTPEQLWEELDNAVNKASQIVYYAEHPLFNSRGRVEQRSVSEQLKELYNGLDQVIKEYIPSASGLVRLTEMDTLEYEKGRFMRYLPEMQNTCNLRAKFGKDYLQLSKSNTELLEGGDNNED